MLWALAFMVTFVIGGMTGVLLAVPPADFVLHNSLFLVAHFHNVIIGGVLFGAFAGYTYWFPKAFGFRLDERCGKAAFWFWVDRLLRRLHAALCARPRRHDAAHAALRRRRVAAVAARRGGRRGADPVRHRLPDRAACRQRSATATRLRDRTGDPWDGRTLEWITASPPPAFNFAVLPECRPARKPIGASSRRRSSSGRLRRLPRVQADRNAAQQPDRICRGLLRRRHRLRADLAHLVDGGRSASLGAFATFVVFAWREHDEYKVPADEVARIDAQRRGARAIWSQAANPACRLVRVAESDDPISPASREPSGDNAARRPSASSPPMASGCSCSPTS